MPNKNPINEPNVDLKIRLSSRIHYVIVQSSVCLPLVLQLQQLDLSDLFQMGHVKAAVGLLVYPGDFNYTELVIGWRGRFGKFDHFGKSQRFVSLKEVRLDGRVIADEPVPFIYIRFNPCTVEV